ncbi:glycoside hydrolase family 3 protein [Chryseotalea sanaruensis]|uniref:Glycoside hydrolase family 3 protein n=1 Tax=Chryseotalea sanaruensis TaxID=2482724 RepID=A0A401U5Z5_9BACT|nr:glycoside hydrolase family 3 N-terminal domain-containing protein [Chryseotalea sanaruensis]GCC50305.1 glycoside hydrolase family 3 protein [Chryseotalea sanaruensis]
MQQKYIFTLVLISLVSHCLAQDTPVFRDVDKPLETRVQDLINQLTLEEKVYQMMHNSPAIPRLNMPAYNWWNEALHGVGRGGVATVFPQAIGLGATFDEDLAFRVSSAISDEARAMFNASVAKGFHKQYGGLTFWTPNINIFRDPRWGRGQETYGEDPYLTSRLGVSFVKGLQGDNPNYLKTAACAKHFAVHSGPEKLRHEFNALSSSKDLWETYLPAFKALVDADVEAVMCAYNRTNDEPCCAHNFLLTDVLRKKWNFKGHVVSDCWAVVDFYQGHNVVKTKAEAVALAVKNGVNLNCGDEYPALVEAVEKGLITEKEIDAALAVLLRTRFKLGLFDPAESNPYNAISTDVINSSKHRALAREAAQKSIVLLKNNGVLPLKNNLAKYFVTGPNASDVQVLLGNYYGVNPQMVTVLEGLAGAVEAGSQLQYRQGILLDRDNVNPQDWTTGNAANSDATFVVLGISGLLEGEEGESIASPYFGDRLDYNLPKNQIDFLKKIREKTTTSVIAVVTGGSPMNLADVHELADAVLLVWYPGQEGGNAVADIVFGKISPSGRLPVTFPKSLDQLPAYEDYTMKGRTYRYMEAEPLYPFGFGLSYTQFEYSNLTLSKSSIKKNEKIEAQVTLTNKGNVVSEEVVQLYLTDVKASTTTPLYSLKGIQRITLEPGKSVVVSFTITPDMLMLVDDKGNSILEPGAFTVSIGGSLPGNRSDQLGAAKTLQTNFTVK